MKKINEIVEEYLAKKIFSEVPDSNPIFWAENFSAALQSDGKIVLHFDCEYVPVSAVKRAENPDSVRGRFELILDPKLRSKDEASPCDMSEKPEYRLIANKIDFVLEAYGFPRNWIAQAAEGIHKPLPERVVTDIQKGLLDQYLSQVEPLWDLDEALDGAMNEKNRGLPRYFIEYAHQKCLNCMKEEQDIAGSLHDSSQNIGEDRRLLESSCGNEPQSLTLVFEHELAYEVLGDREKRMCVTRIEPALVLDEFGWPNPGVKLDLRIRDKHSLFIVKDLPVALCDSRSRTGVVIGTKIDAHLSFLLGHHIEDILQAYNYSYEAVLETLDCRNGLTVTKKDFYAIGKYLADGREPDFDNVVEEEHWNRLLSELKARGGEKPQINFAYKTGEIRDGDVLYRITCKSASGQIPRFEPRQDLSPIQQRALDRMFAQNLDINILSQYTDAMNQELPKALTVAACGKFVSLWEMQFPAQFRNRGIFPAREQSRGGR